MTSKAPLSPRQKVVNPDGTPDRHYWLWWNNIQNIGTTESPLVVKGSALLQGGTISSGGTIQAADVPGHSLLGNAGASAGQPQTVGIDATLGFVNAGSIGIATQAAFTVLGRGSNAGQPYALTLGGNLSIQGNVLTDGGGGGGGGSTGDDLGYYAASYARNRAMDLENQLAAQEKQIQDALTLGWLALTRRQLP